ncbi:MAG: glutathione S-transferase N-terminal domain-containing protein [Proteobacteria bacterium]|nr:glutathione S-transferase N-terminal domain-containing protein [Pseudomonadota bacterium]
MAMIIYGKPGCPYTIKARSAHPEAAYVDVTMDPAKLDEMLKLTDGARKVPVLVEDGKVTIGFGGT